MGPQLRRGSDFLLRLRESLVEELGHAALNTENLTLQVQPS
jgi:hypothetical protein